MARPGVKKEAILKAADELEEEGVPVTVPAVRSRLGDRGSYTTLSAAIKEWRALREKAELTPVPAPPPTLVRLTTRVWGEAWQAAQQAMETEREALTQARIQLEQERKTMGAEIARLEQAVEQTQRERSFERTSRQKCVDNLAELKIEAARRGERYQALEHQLQRECEQRKRVEQQGKALQEELSIERKAREQSDKALAKTETEVLHLKARCQSLKTQLQEARERSQRLEDELVELARGGRQQKKS